MFIFEDMFYNNLDEMMVLASIFEEEDDDTEYLDFDSKNQDEWNEFYGVD